MVLALAIAASFYPNVAAVTTDSESYLDVATNLLDGHGLVTRIVDSWRPAAPDPLGLWPPGYPVAIALAGRLGMPLEAAARSLSVASFMVFAAAFHALARRAALGRGGALAVTALALATTGIARASVMAWSEMPYLALVTLGLVRALAFEEPGGRGAARAFVAGLALGLAAITRTIGILVIPLAGLALRHFRSTRAATVAWWLGALAPPAVWLVHNQIYFGSPLGPPGAAPDRGAAEIARATLSGLRWGLLPEPLAASTAISYTLLAGIVLGGLVALRLSLAARIAAGVALVHVVAVAVLRGSYMGERFLTPGYPFLWLAAGATLAELAASGARVFPWAARALTVLLLVAAAFDLRTAVGTARASDSGARAARVHEMDELRRLVPAGTAPVLSEEGHRVRHATGRSAIELPGPRFRVREFSAEDERRWREAGLDLAVFRRAVIEPPAGAPPAAETLGSHLASRLAEWERIDSSATFVLYRIPRGGAENR